MTGLEILGVGLLIALAIAACVLALLAAAFLVVVAAILTALENLRLLIIAYWPIIQAVLERAVSLPRQVVEFLGDRFEQMDLGRRRLVLGFLVLTASSLPIAITIRFYLGLFIFVVGITEVAVCFLLPIVSIAPPEGNQQILKPAAAETRLRRKPKQHGLQQGTATRLPVAQMPRTINRRSGTIAARLGKATKVSDGLPSAAAESTCLTAADVQFLEKIMQRPLASSEDWSAAGVMLLKITMQEMNVTDERRWAIEALTRLTLTHRLPVAESALNRIGSILEAQTGTRSKLVVTWARFRLVWDETSPTGLANGTLKQVAKEDDEPDKGNGRH